MRLRREQCGFTVLEVLVVSLILGILSAIAIYNYFIAIQRGRQKRSMADMRTIASAWEQRAADKHRFNGAGQVFTFPSEAVTASDLTLALSPTYLRTLPANDGWERPYEFAANEPFSSTEPASTYALRSAGRDGQFQGAYNERVTTDFDCDIVFSNGSFVVGP